MRITNDVVVGRSLQQLNRRLDAFERAQSRVADGRRFRVPSDDPGATQRAMTVRSAISARTQELRNGTDAKGWLNSADTQLQSAMQQTQRARELVVGAASFNDSGSRAGIAVELREIAGELASIANSTHLGRPLFGGYTTQDPVTVDASGAVTFEPPAGQADEVLRRISDSEQVRVNITAAEWLGADDPAGDLVTVLRGLADSIQGNDADAAGNGITALDTAVDRIGAALGTIGSTTNRVEAAEQRTTQTLLSLRTELSSIEDVDIAEGIMELRTQELGYQATLQALSKALPPSLGSFLR